MPYSTPAAGIYLIQNTKNGKVYIGRTTNLRRRWNNHKRDLNNQKHHNQHLQRAWNKYGEKVFKFMVLERCPKEQLREREQHYLDIYIKQSICYNESASADGGGGIPTEETRRKLSESHKGQRRPQTLEARQRLSELYTGEGNPNYGKTISEETRRKKSEAMKIKYATDEEFRRKLSEALSGENHPLFGKHHSEEARNKIGDANRGKPKPPRTAEHRQHLSESLKGRVMSDESRKKMSLAKLGKKRAPRKQDT